MRARQPTLTLSGMKTTLGEESFGGASAPAALADTGRAFARAVIGRELLTEDRTAEGDRSRREVSVSPWSDHSITARIDATTVGALGG